MLRPGEVQMSLWWQNWVFWCLIVPAASALLSSSRQNQTWQSSSFIKKKREVWILLWFCRNVLRWRLFWFCSLCRFFFALLWQNKKKTKQKNPKNIQTGFDRRVWADGSLISQTDLFTVGIWPSGYFTDNEANTLIVSVRVKAGRGKEKTKMMKMKMTGRSNSPFVFGWRFVLGEFGQSKETSELEINVLTKAWLQKPADRTTSDLGCNFLEQ